MSTFRQLMMRKKGKQLSKYLVDSEVYFYSHFDNSYTNLCSSGASIGQYYCIFSNAASKFGVYSLTGNSSFFDLTSLTKRSSQDYTFEFWFKYHTPYSSSANNVMITMPETGGFIFGRESEGHYIIVKDNVANYFELDETVWHHFAFTHNSNGYIWTFFIDGTKLPNTFSYQKDITGTISASHNILYISEFVVHNNIRYTENFEVPTEQYVIIQ